MSYLPSLFQEGFIKVKVKATVIHTSMKITCGQARAWHIWGAQQVPAATTVQVQYDSLAGRHIQLRLSTIKAQRLVVTITAIFEGFLWAGTVLRALDTAFLLTTNSCDWCHHPHFTKKELKNWGSERLDILPKLTWEALELMEELGFEIRQVSVTRETSPTGCQWVYEQCPQWHPSLQCAQRTVS